MLLISTNEFQANPNLYLDKVDNGQELFLESDKGQIYQIISDPHTIRPAYLSRCSPGIYIGT